MSQEFNWGAFPPESDTYKLGYLRTFCFGTAQSISELTSMAQAGTYSIGELGPNFQFAAKLLHDKAESFMPTGKCS